MPYQAMSEEKISSELICIIITFSHALFFLLAHICTKLLWELILLFYREQTRPLFLQLDMVNQGCSEQLVIDPSVRLFAYAVHELT